jgi:Na+/H+-dicarboxylate symporter
MTSPHDQRLPVRLSPRHQRWLYGAAGILAASGLGWLIAHYLLPGSGAFGDVRNASEPWWLRLHGAAAMGFLCALGSVLPSHSLRAWRQRRNHRSGLSVLGMAALLVATGYALYYVGDEQSRPWFSAIHWIVGLGATVGLPLHVRIGRRRPSTPRTVTPRPAIR